MRFMLVNLTCGRHVMVTPRRVLAVIAKIKRYGIANGRVEIYGRGLLGVRVPKSGTTVEHILVENNGELWRVLRNSQLKTWWTRPHQVSGHIQ